MSQDWSSKSIFLIETQVLSPFVFDFWKVVLNLFNIKYKFFLHSGCFYFSEDLIIFMVHSFCLFSLPTPLFLLSASFLVYCASLYSAPCILYQTLWVGIFKLCSLFLFPKCFFILYLSWNVIGLTLHFPLSPFTFMSSFAYYITKFASCAVIICVYKDIFILSAKIFDSYFYYLSYNNLWLVYYGV